MRILDAQIHVWRPDSPQRPWPPWGARHAHLGGGPFTADDVIATLDAAGVNGAVVVPPSFEGDRGDYVIEAARAYPARLAAMVRVPFTAASDAMQVVRDIEAQPGVFGVRLSYTRAPVTNGRSWLVNGAFDRFWPVAEASDLPMMIYAPGYTDQLLELLRRHPRLHIIVDHCNLGLDLKDATAVAAIHALDPLAEFERVAVKASALPYYFSEGPPFPAVQESVRHLVATFGASRVFWGSDITRLRCEYRDLVRVFRDDCAFLSAAERADVLGEGLANWLRWDPDG